MSAELTKARQEAVTEDGQRVQTRSQLESAAAKMGLRVVGTCETCEHSVPGLSIVPGETLCLHWRAHFKPTDGCTDHEPRKDDHG